MFRKESDFEAIERVNVTKPHRHPATASPVASPQSLPPCLPPMAPFP